jgi:hypothetical protein
MDATAFVVALLLLPDAEVMMLGNGKMLMMFAFGVVVMLAIL